MFLGGLFEFLSILLIGSFFVIGYQIEVIQRVMRKEPNVLPDWDRLSEKLLRGIKLFVVSFIYVVPLLLIILPIVLFIIFGAASESEELATFGGMTLLSALILIVLPYSLLLNIFMPVIYLKFAMKESLSDALNLAAILRFFKQNWQNVIILALIMVGVNLLATFGLLFCIIGIFFTGFYAKLISAHLTGQLYLASAESQSSGA